MVTGDISTRLGALDREATSRYESAWDARDRLVLANAAFLAALLPGAGLVVAFVGSGALALGLLLAWLLGFFIAHALLWAWLCPRCGEAFHWPGGVPFSRSRLETFKRVRCGSCGLARRVHTRSGAARVQRSAREFQVRS